MCIRALLLKDWQFPYFKLEDRKICQHFSWLSSGLEHLLISRKPSSPPSHSKFAWKDKQRERAWGLVHVLDIDYVSWTRFWSGLGHPRILILIHDQGMHSAYKYVWATPTTNSKLCSHRETSSVCNTWPKYSRHSPSVYLLRIKWMTHKEWDWFEAI